MKIFTEPLYLRPSIDLLFKNEEDLDLYFRSNILDFIIDGGFVFDGECEVYPAAVDFFNKTETIWYFEIDTNIFEINPKDFNTNDETKEFLLDLIYRNEESVQEVYDSLSNY
jgi:hypothetical protein